MSTTAESASHLHEERLRDAVRDAVAAGSSSLRWDAVFSLVQSDRDRQILREETAPEQALVDLHLDGSGVTGHSTSATRFAKFVQRISEATKETAKQIASASRYTENLLIEGVGTGSVRLVLRAPEVPPDPKRPAFEGLPHDTADSVALRRIASMLTFASQSADTPDDDVLAGLARELPPIARDRLKSAATEIITARWNVQGSVMQRQRPEESVVVTTRGAERVRAALQFTPSEPERQDLVGTLDGFKYSLGVAYFLPDRASRAFSATVRSDELFARVARLAEDKDRVVVGTFEVFTESGGTESRPRVSRVLVDIRPAAASQGAQGSLI